MRPEPAPAPGPALQAVMRHRSLPPADQASKREAHTLQMAKLGVVMLFSWWVTTLLLLLHYVAKYSQELCGPRQAFTCLPVYLGRGMWGCCWQQ